MSDRRIAFGAFRDPGVYCEPSRPRIKTKFGGEETEKDPEGSEFNFDQPPGERKGTEA